MFDLERRQTERAVTEMFNKLEGKKKKSELPVLQSNSMRTPQNAARDLTVILSD